MNVTRRASALECCLASTVLVSAFLVFQVQPLISKFILPWFGGSPAVWTTCLLFFQLVLFAGYAYAHLLTRLSRPSWQAIIHLGLLVLGLSLLPITPSDDWKPADAFHPTSRILALLAANVGVPYFLLSSTGPLIQAWFARSAPGKSPYRLYALSNVGSLVALVSYPFLVEPAWGSAAQGRFWSLGFTLFALLCCYAAFRTGCLSNAASTTSPDHTSADETRPTWVRRLAWIGYAAVPSIMLLAMTNHVCQDVAAIPFLWVLPLGLYLVSFIICFEKEQWYSPRLFGPLTALLVCVVCVLPLLNQLLDLWVEVALYMSALFAICMLCHGELVRLKPSARDLTSFYLMTSAGGALGGITVALIAPRLFNSYLELNLGLVACYVIAIFASLSSHREQPLRHARWAAGIAFLGLLFVVRSQASTVAVAPLAQARDFYGVIGVDEHNIGEAQHRREMRHGRIVHGQQFWSPERRREPTLYYSTATGIGRAIDALQQDRASLRIGVVGLGVGTLATYGRPQDTIRYYEINPEVERLARQYFTFLDDSPAQIETVLGDARLMLEREAPQVYDLLVLDAFSGDAIPAHLLTREALAIYQLHLAPGGMLAVHISNRHVDLLPVVRGLAEAGKLAERVIHTDPAAVEHGATAAKWVLLAADEHWFEQAQIGPNSSSAAGRTIHWSDDFSNVFEIVQ